MADDRIEDIKGLIRGKLVSGSANTATGVIVLGGSSGRVDVERARLFAAAGSKALALQWFGGEGQAQGICEIPLETLATRQTI
jgi:uncharacterized protein